MITSSVFIPRTLVVNIVRPERVEQDSSLCLRLSFKDDGEGFYLKLSADNFKAVSLCRLRGYHHGRG